MTPIWLIGFSVFLSLSLFFLNFLLFFISFPLFLSNFLFTCLDYFQEYLLNLFENYVDNGLTFARKKCVQAMQQVMNLYPFYMAKK